MLSTIAGIRTAARRNAYAPALVTDARVVTYADLEGLIARISNTLIDRGTQPLTRIFLNVGDPDLRLIVMLAAMHAGMIPFALLERGEPDDLGPHIVVGAGPPHVPALAADVMIDQATLSGSSGDAILRGVPDRADGEILFVGSTTGTTGKRQLVASLHRTAPVPIDGTSTLNFAPSDRVMATYGDVTTVGLLIARAVLESGATHVRYPRDADHCVRLINFTAVSELRTGPSTLSNLLDVMERTGARCPSVKTIRMTGSLFHKRLVERIEAAFDAEISVSYGSTEARVLTRGNVTSATFDVGYVGQLLPGVAFIGAGTHDNPAPITVLNTRVPRTPYYVRGKVLPAPAGPMTLPDIGYMRDGSLYLVGRSDEVFNASGNKTAYSVIEHDLLALPDVRDVGIVGGAAIADPTGLLVAVAGGVSLAAATVRKCVAGTTKARDAESSIHVVLVASIPRNAMGKVDREAVARAYQSAAGARSGV